jgi:ketosteroid isomerase-like protein
MNDLETIKQLKARYFRLMDTKDWATWGDVFADDATLLVDTAVSTGGRDPHPMPQLRGRDTIVNHVSGVIDACVTVHHGHMPEIELTSPDTATGIWAMEDIVEWPGERLLRGYGHYHESYRKGMDGVWRIATLHLTRLRLDITDLGTSA